MISWIVDSSLKLRYLVVTVAIAILFLGVVQLREMPVDVLPEFAPPYVEIQTEALGLSAEEVEALITLPMEANLLNGMAWLDVMYSESVNGLSSIVLVFEPGTDLIRARQMVQERLTQAHSLPNVSKPPTMLQPLSSASRFMMIGLSSEELTPIEMSVLARWNIKPRLMGVPGVANVSIWGQRERQLQVQVDPEQLQAQGVTLAQIIETTGNALWVSPLSFLNASTPGSGGFIDTPNQRLGIQHLLPISTAGDLAQVTVVGTGGALQLGDVSQVVEDHQPLIGDAILGQGTGLLLVVEKFPGANTLEVTREVEKALEALKLGLPGLEMDSTLFRPASFIELAIANLSEVLLLAVLLVVVVLLAFLWDWRVAFISLVTIPLSLVVAGLVLYFRGATFNTMLLAGLVIALGAIIDDAVGDVEHIRRRLRQHRAAGESGHLEAVVREAAVEMRTPVGYATLLLVLAIVPAFFLQGLSGAFLGSLAISYVLAVLASMVVALTVTPALSLLLLADAPLARRDSPLVRGLRRGYDPTLRRLIQAPRVAYVGALATVALGLAMWPFLRQELLPTFKETELLIEWEGNPGTSLPAMNRITQQVSEELRAIPGVRGVSAHVGRALTSDEAVNVDSGELWVSLDPAADYEQTVAAVEEVVDGYPGLSRDVGTYLEESVEQELRGTDEAVVVRIYGNDLTVLRQKAQEVRERLATLDGIVEPQVDRQVEETHLKIQVDLARAERYGVKPGDVRRTAATLLAGIEVGSLFEQQKVFDVIVVGTPETRHSLSSIRDLLVDTPDGSHVRLGEVADIRIEPVPNVIRREGVSRYIDVSASVSGRNFGAIASDIERVLADIEFPREHHAELLGDYAERQAVQQRLSSVMVAALIAIFLLLQACFDNWRLATLAFLSLPVALAGGVVAIFLSGGTLSLGALVGLLTVLGIAARNGVTLISHYQYLRSQEKLPFGSELVERGAQERVTPILITALTTAVALVPLAIAGNVPGLEVLHPMALVILGGLVTSTLLNLFLVPVLYLRFGATTAPEPTIPPVAAPIPSLPGD